MMFLPGGHMGPPLRPSTNVVRKRILRCCRKKWPWNCGLTGQSNDMTSQVLSNPFRRRLVCSGEGLLRERLIWVDGRCGTW